MDANKLISGVLVGLLIGSIFAVAPATAQDADDAPDAVFDAAKTTSVGGVSYLVAPATNDAGPITYNSSWDLVITNLTANGAYTLTANGASSGVQTTAVRDGLHSNSSVEKYNVTFAAANIGGVGKFNQVGSWWVNGTGFSQRILVKADENLRVSLSRDSFTYTTDLIRFTITVTDLTTGAPVQGAALSLGALDTGLTNAVTNPDGVYVWTGKAPGAGTYYVNATKQGSGSASGGDPEFSGSSTLTVNPASLTASTVKTDVLKGFDGYVEFNFTYPNGQPVFGRLGTTDGLNPITNDYKVNVTYPSGCWIVYYGSSDTVGPATSTNPASTCTNNLNKTLIVTTDGSSRGNIRFYDNSTSGWPSGTFSMVVEVNAAGAGSSLTASGKPEYAATVRWTPGAPGDVNLEVVNGLTNSKIDVANRNIATDSGLPSSGAVTVKVTGSYKAQHPVGTATGTKWDQFTTAKNVTLEGDYLKLVDANGATLAPSIGAMDYATGEFTINNLYPTKGGGEIRVLINWKNVTTTLTIPIGKGAQVSGDKSEIVVDTTSAITFTLRGPSGALDPYGEVRLYRVTGAGTTTAIDSTPKFLSGDGTAGNGLDGQYTFTLKESELGTYVAYGIVGETNANYTYTTFRVVPAHDLISSVVKGAQTTAGKTTTISVNVTKASGATYPTPAQNPQFYFLNSGQLKNFLENGTLPTSPNTGFTVYQASSKIVSYNFSEALGPDTYTLYIKDYNGKHDNLDAMPTVQAHHVNVAFSPSGIMNNTNIQANETITVTVTDYAGMPINGTLVFDPASTGAALFYGANVTGTTAPFVKVVNGVATFKATASKLGSIRWEFNPESTSTTSRPGAGFPDALGTFEVVTPNVIVTPSKIPYGRPSNIDIQVKDLKGAPVPNIPVKVCGAPIGGGCTDDKVTDSNGRTLLGVNPFATGNLTLRINGSATPTVVNVFAGLNLVTNPTDPQTGQLVVISVAQTGSDNFGEQGATVEVTDADGATVHSGTTDISGVVHWTPAAEGTYTISASKLGFETATKTVTVSVPPPPPPPQEAKISISDLQTLPADGKVTVGALATVTTKVANTGNAAGEAVLKLKVNGATFETKTVPLAAGETDTVAFQFTPSAAQDYRVSVALVGGSELDAKTISASLPATPPPQTTPTPDNNGGTPTPSPSPTAGPSGVPGFEAVFAIAALGAALLVFGRRKN